MSAQNKNLQEQLTNIIELVVPRRFRRIVFSIALDVVVIQIAYTVAFFARAASTPVDYVQGLTLNLIATISIILCLHFFGVYRRIWSRTSGYNVSVLIKAVALATIVIGLIDAIPTEHPTPLSIVFIGNLIALVGFVATRFRSRMFTGVSWRWRAVMLYQFPTSVTRVLIIGTGNTAQELAVQLKHRVQDQDHIYVVVGFVDHNTDMRGLLIEGSPILGAYDEIPTLTEEYQIDLLVVAVGNVATTEFRAIVNTCEKTKARIKLAPNLLELMGTNTGAALLRDIEPEDLIGRSPIKAYEGVDLSLLKNKCILVTGAAGSIGSELCRQLYAYQIQELIALDNNESNLHELSIELTTKFPLVKLTPVLADITIKDTLQPVFATYHPQVVFHAAAYKHVPMLERFPNEAMRVNVGGTRLLAQLACDYKVERFVLISTDKAVNPSSVMGTSKRMCELLLHSLAQENKDTLFASVRFGNVLGSRGSVVPTFNQQIENGGPITVTHPDMTRYFMSIAEAANLVIHAACLTTGNDTFILRMGDVVRIVDLAERMIRLRGLRPYKDIDIQFTGVRPGEKLYEQLHSDAEKLTDTIHPGIMRLQTKLETFDGRNFLKTVDQMLKAGLGTTPNQMTALILDAGTPKEQLSAGIVLEPLSITSAKENPPKAIPASISTERNN